MQSVNFSGAAQRVAVSLLSVLVTFEKLDQGIFHEVQGYRQGLTNWSVRLKFQFSC